MPDRRIAHITLVVKDYDEAIKFYTEKLDFKLIEDITLSEQKRWVLISPTVSPGCCLLLGKAADEKQAKCIGNQTGGRVFLFLHTGDFWHDYFMLKNKGVNFVREPSEESYGTVAVFEDLYGNLWDLIEKRK